MILADVLPLATDSLPSLMRDSIPVITPQAVASEVKNFDWSGVIESLTQGAVSLAFRLTAAIVVFLVGRFVITKLHNVLRRVMLTRNVERSLMTFLLSVFRFTFLFILVVMVIGLLGIETSSFVAIFASAGVALGMAMSGTLQNFAGGVLLLMLKPYKVGDFIEYDKYKGFVREIQIFHTVIATINNEIIIVPNGGLSTGVVNNYSREKYRRVEWRVSISYGDDVDVARRVALEILHDDARVLDGVVDADDGAVLTSGEGAEQNEPAEATKRAPWWRRLFSRRKSRIKEGLTTPHMATGIVTRLDCTPTVQVEAMDDSAVVLLVRGWCATADYWPVFYAINEAIYKQFPLRGLHFPFPQVDVHINPEKS